MDNVMLGIVAVLFVVCSGCAVVVFFHNACDDDEWE